jgi:benzoylformate decarboxylase
MSRYLASELLADQLAVEGTRLVFGKPGRTNLPFLETVAKRSDIQYVQALNEATAVLMATGFAQASGKHGVIDVDSAPGLLAALAGILNARESRIPLVILGGQTSTDRLNDMNTSERDICSLAAPFCKWTAQLNDPSELARLLRRAFHEAASPPAGPTFVSLPVDLMSMPTTSRVTMPPRMSPLGAADSSFIKRTAQLLIASTKPVLLLGNEVWQYHARSAAVSLAEVLGCPVFVEAHPTGINFPNQHPLFAGELPGDKVTGDPKIFEGADVMLALGVHNRTNFFSGAASLPTTTVVVQINTDPLLAGHGLPCHFCASADLTETLSRMRAEIQLVVDTQWVTRAKERLKETQSWIESERSADAGQVSRGSTGEGIQVADLVRQLDAMRPLKSVIVNGFGSLSPLAMRFMKLEHGSEYLATNGRSPGYALPAALGVKWASPEYVVLCLTRDSSLLSHPQALWTASHYNLAVKVVVLNNQGYGPVAQAAHTDDPMNMLELRDPPVSFLDLAAAMGLPANTISTRSELEPGISEMLKTDGPYLLDVKVPR